MEILARVSVFGDVARIAGGHHERLDGGGYHRGLTAAELDQPSRILAVADEVIGIMRRDAGRGLDSGALAALEQVLPAWSAEAR
jgi:hypothetical protein